MGGEIFFIQLNQKKFLLNQKKKLLVLGSAAVERFSVSRMRDFLLWVSKCVNKSSTLVLSLMMTFKTECYNKNILFIQGKRYNQLF